MKIKSIARTLRHQKTVAFQTIEKLTREIGHVEDQIGVERQAKAKAENPRAASRPFNGRRKIAGYR